MLFMDGDLYFWQKQSNGIDITLAGIDVKIKGTVCFDAAGHVCAKFGRAFAMALSIWGSASPSFHEVCFHSLQLSLFCEWFTKHSAHPYGLAVGR